IRDLQVSAAGGMLESTGNVSPEVRHANQKAYPRASPRKTRRPRRRNEDPDARQLPLPVLRPGRRRQLRERLDDDGGLHHSPRPQREEGAAEPGGRLSALQSAEGPASLPQLRGSQELRSEAEAGRAPALGTDSGANTRC